MNDNFHERLCRCAMGKIFGFEPGIAQVIIENLGSGASLFALSQNELYGLLGPFSKFAPSINEKALDESAEELEMLQSMGISFISELDEEYPRLLKECPDRPVGLYVKGWKDLESSFREHPPVALVGTRDLSLYGKEWTRRIVDALAGAKVRPTIVSGMAIGCDINAHLAACEASLPTVAVLPTCVDTIYPMSHRIYERRIMENPFSAMLSDYPTGTQAKAINFIRRNRIIAGLSFATIIVESKSVGGGLITVNMAQSYGRDIYALPGRIDDIRSEGCNTLLQRKIAEPITDLDVLVEALGLGLKARRRKNELSEELREKYAGQLGSRDLESIVKVATAIKSRRGISTDELCVQLGMDYPELIRFVGQLEADGIVSLDLLQRCSINVKIV